jgi:hypothetical protein
MSVEKAKVEVILERYFIHEDWAKHSVIVDKEPVCRDMNYKTIGAVWSTAPENARYDWECQKVMAQCESYC